jgi:hypothetical protein
VNLQVQTLEALQSGDEFRLGEPHRPPE